MLLSAPFTYQVECKQPSYQIEITAPAFILFDVELRLKSHVVDLSSAAHVQYDGEQVTIFLIFPVPGEYVCRVKCKPSWREIDVYDNCLTYKLTSHTGLVPLSSNKDVIIGHLQHRKVNARDSRSLFNRHFTLLHPLSGHLIPKAPFIVQIKGPDIADSVIVACNGVRHATTRHVRWCAAVRARAQVQPVLVLTSLDLLSCVSRVVLARIGNGCRRLRWPKAASRCSKVRRTHAPLRTAARSSESEQANPEDS